MTACMTLALFFPPKKTPGDYLSDLIFIKVLFYLLKIKGDNLWQNPQAANSIQIKVISRY
jgi:hypothetical protein